MSGCVCSSIPRAMWSANSWKIPAEAGISRAWRAMPPENGSSLLQTIEALGCGYCGSSSIAMASPYKQPPRNNPKYWSPMVDNPVLQAMRTVRFDTMGANRSYFDFYMGFGYTLSVSQVMLTILLWQLATLARSDARRLRPLIAVIALATAVSGVSCTIRKARSPCRCSTTEPTGNCFCSPGSTGAISDLPLTASAAPTPPGSTR